jgi:hypothetical protein
MLKAQHAETWKHITEKLSSANRLDGMQRHPTATKNSCSRSKPAVAPDVAAEDGTQVIVIDPAIQDSTSSRLLPGI